MNEYSDGSSENTDAMNIKYYSISNETNEETGEDPTPYIDICYKEVAIKRCGENTTAVTLDVEMSVVLVDDDKNHNNESLSVGTDLDGTKKRFLIKFNLDKLNQGNFVTTNISQAFIHLNFLDYTDGEETERANRTLNVFHVANSWRESGASWNTVITDAGAGVIGEGAFEEERLGGTMYTIELDQSAVRDWVDGVKENYGVMVVDTNEDLSSRIPLFSDNTNEDEDGFKPSLEVCIPTTVTPTTPAPTTTQPATVSSGIHTTVTTKPVFNAERCTVKTQTPELVTINKTTTGADNETLCVSVEPMELKICVDEQNTCIKKQMRNPYGVLVTECKCCVPVLQTETRTFECTPADGSGKYTAELEIKSIATCQCSTCENTIYVDHTYRREKRALGFSPGSSQLL